MKRFIYCMCKLINCAIIENNVDKFIDGERNSAASYISSCV